MSDRDNVLSIIRSSQRPVILEELRWQTQVDDNHLRAILSNLMAQEEIQQLPAPNYHSEDEAYIYVGDPS